MAKKKNYKSGSFKIRKEFVLNDGWVNITDMLQGNGNRTSVFDIFEMGMILESVNISFEIVGSVEKIFAMEKDIPYIQNLFRALHWIMCNIPNGEKADKFFTDVSKITSCKSVIDLVNMC